MPADRQNHPCATEATRPRHLRLRAATAFALCTATVIAFTLGATLPAIADEHDDTQVGATASLTFEPDTVTITQGGSVSWVWEGGGTHTVTSTDSLDDHEPNGDFDYALTSDTGPIEHTFDEPGTYHYYCKPHSGAGMQGTIIVEAEEDEGADEDDQNVDEDDQDETIEQDAPENGDEETDDENGETPMVGPVLFALVLTGSVILMRRSR